MWWMPQPIAIPCPPPPSPRTLPQLLDIKGKKIDGTPQELCVLPWQVPKWVDSGALLTGPKGVCSIASKLSWPLLHVIARELAEGRHPQASPVTLEDLPWNQIIRTVFTRAADCMQCCRGQPFEPEFLIRLLEHQNLDTLAGLRQALAHMAAIAPAIRMTMNQQFTANQLRVLTRPGAYLLDTTFTMILILKQKISAKRLPNLKYEVVSNRALAAVAREVFPAADSPRSLNYIGNSVESMAWLLLEADRCDMILAVAYHCGKYMKKFEV